MKLDVEARCQRLEDYKMFNRLLISSSGECVGNVWDCQSLDHEVYWIKGEGAYRKAY